MLFTKANADNENNNACLESNKLEKPEYVLLIRIVKTENFSSSIEKLKYSVLFTENMISINYAIFYIYL